MKKMWREKAIVLNFLIMLVVLCARVDGIKWLSLKEQDVTGYGEEASKDIVADEGMACGMSEELGPYPCGTLVHVARAATLTKTVCKQFHSLRRWNCSSIDLAPNFTPELLLGTKEQSFVYALSSASLMYTMARACSSGVLFSCTCGQPSRDRPGGDFKWGGCSDNLKWAGRFVRQFVETSQKARNKQSREENKDTTEVKNEIHPKFEVTTSSSSLDAENATHQSYINETNDALGRQVASLVKRDRRSQRKKFNRKRKPKKLKELNPLALEKRLKKLQPFIDAANLQNSKAGRKLMERSMSIQCKCHGVSGSCSVRTCWRSLKPLIQVADRLWGAVSRSVRATSPRPRPWSYKRPNELLFVSPSPDYCSYDPSVGSLGTQDRWCNATSRSLEGSCKNMCCGRGYKIFVNETIERCNCKYIWCCKVECKVCKITMESHYCN